MRTTCLTASEVNESERRILTAAILKGMDAHFS